MARHDFVISVMICCSAELKTKRCYPVTIVTSAVSVRTFLQFTIVRRRSNQLRYRFSVLSGRMISPARRFAHRMRQGRHARPQDARAAPFRRVALPMQYQ
jgi:hypothetical protein